MKKVFLGQEPLNGRAEAGKKMLNLQKVDDGAIFRVKVQPGAGKNDIVGVKGDALKIEIMLLG